MSTLDVESRRIELHSVEAVAARDASSPPELLMVLNATDGSPIDGAVVSLWTDTDVPNFSDFKIIILEVPTSSETYESYRQDLRLADIAGATVAWIATAESSAAVLAQITGVEVLRFRSAVSSARCTIVDRRFEDRKSTRLNSSHANISYAVFCLKKK